MASASKTDQFEDNTLRNLLALLEEIHRGEMGLPDFQRDFVWAPPMIRELIVSVAYGTYAGSVLRIPHAQRLFTRREFQGAPPLKDCQPNFLTLDGQQRLTSLYQAFYGVGEHRYCGAKPCPEGASVLSAWFSPSGARAGAHGLAPHSPRAKRGENMWIYVVYWRGLTSKTASSRCERIPDGHEG